MNVLNNHLVNYSERYKNSKKYNKNTYYDGGRNYAIKIKLLSVSFDLIEEIK